MKKKIVIVFTLVFVLALCNNVFAADNYLQMVDFKAMQPFYSLDNGDYIITQTDFGVRVDIINVENGYWTYVLTEEGVMGDYVIPNVEGYDGIVFRMRTNAFEDAQLAVFIDGVNGRNYIGNYSVLIDTAGNTVPAGYDAGPSTIILNGPFDGYIFMPFSGYQTDGAFSPEAQRYYFGFVVAGYWFDCYAEFESLGAYKGTDYAGIINEIEQVGVAPPVEEPPVETPAEAPAAETPAETPAENAPAAQGGNSAAVQNPVTGIGFENLLIAAAALLFTVLGIAVVKKPVYKK